MTARRDPDPLIQAFLDEGQAELPDRTYDAVRAEIDHTRQRVVFGPLTERRIHRFARFAFAVAAVTVVVVVGINLLPRLGDATPGPASTPSPSPSPTASPAGFPQLGGLSAGAYFVYPFITYDPAICGYPVHSDATSQPCEEATTDDTIRFTFTVPDGWRVLPFYSIGLASEENAPPDGAGMIFVRGGWLYSDPCITDESVQLNGADPNVPIGPTVDDFTNALAEHPLLDVTAPVDVTLAGYGGKYVDLQVPADISSCNVYYPWEGGASLYAQGPAHRWHLWILDVDGIRVVVQATDYPGTSAEHQAELEEIVDSIQITP